MLIVTAASNEGWVTDPIESQFDAMLKFMKWEDVGRILARGCAVRADIEGSNYLEMAYKAGKDLI